MKKPEGGNGKKVEFRFLAEAGSEVFVAGTFNNWDPKAQPMKDNPGAGHYKAAIRLPPGRYEYKFVVNGEWWLDPICPESTPNDQGSMNSVLRV